MTGTDGDPLNPVDAEKRILEITNELGRGVRIVSDRQQAAVEADREFDVAYARAYLDHQGPQAEKRYAADLATRDERQTRDVADTAYRYARDRARALESELSALQTISKGLAAHYSAAGRGEW